MTKRSQYKIAVGVEYDLERRKKEIKAGEGPTEQDAPVVEIKGDELIADEIVRAAQRFGVPIIEDPELAKALNALEVDQEIPAELFEAVAIALNEIEKRTKK
jgi:flagellar biosynthesis protein